MAQAAAGRGQEALDPNAKSAIRGAWLGFFVDMFDIYLPIVVLAPKDSMFDKLKANMQEVHARHGELFVFASEESKMVAEDRMHVVYVPEVCETLAPIVYSVPVQLLSYHVAVMRGTDVDQPRNLAKSVTVE